MSSKQATPYRPQLEALEDRQLLAASISLQSGVLNIRGSNRADTVIVETVRDQVLVIQPGRGVQAREFAADRVNQINFRGLRGNDVFINDTAIPSTASGGVGRDLLAGGAAIDQLFGGAGFDRMFGGINDVMIGGGGNDLLRQVADFVGLSGLNGLGFFGSGPSGSTNLSGFNTTFFDPSLFLAPNFSGFNGLLTTSPSLSSRDPGQLLLTGLTPSSLLTTGSSTAATLTSGVGGLLGGLGNPLLPITTGLVPGLIGGVSPTSTLAALGGGLLNPAASVNSLLFGLTGGLGRLF